MTRFEPRHLNGAPTVMVVVFLSVLSGGIVAAQAPPAEAPDDLSITVGKSVLVSSDQPIERISVGYGDIAEATAVGPKEILVNAKAAGSTSMIVWQQGGGKLFFDVNVRPSQFLANNRLTNVRREIAKELPGQDITLTVENDAVFLRGAAKDLTSVDRAVTIASTLGKPVNLLYVNVPTADPQILLKVRFASLDRTLSTTLGINLFSTGAANTIGAISTQQFPNPQLPQGQGQAGTSTPASPFVFTDLLNIFLYRPDLNLGATIKALEAKGVLQTLAEPNVLAINGKQASFLAGGEFPYPIVQGAALAGAVTIQFREFGVRLNFIPTITPRGTIRLQVAPEVSALDYSNALVVGGYNIPALITRKVNTEVELEEGQSFAIGGLLDKRVTDVLSKVPFIGDLPILGKFFQSKSTNRQNTELVVIVTPELVQPVPKGTTLSGLPFPKAFMESKSDDLVRTPGIAKTGPAPTAAVKSIPVEKMIESLKAAKQLDPNVGSIRSQSSSGTPQNNASDSPGFEAAGTPMAAPTAPPH
jgi:pilus assembly protein CpaC